MTAKRTDSTPIDARDEGLHPNGPQPEWQESVFLAWRDSVRGVGGNHRIGNEINRGTANIWFGLYTDSGVRYRDNREGLQFERVARGYGLKAGPQQLFHDGDVLRYIAVNEEYSVNIVIEDLPGSQKWGHTSPTQMAVSQREHFDTHCRVSGKVSIGDEELVVDGYGWRDHSWGPREWDKILNVRIIAGNFGGKRPYGFYSNMHANGNVSRSGMINLTGRWEDISDFTLTVAVEEDGVSARSAEVRSVLADGTPFDLHFDLSDSVLVKIREYTSVEGVGDVINLETGEKGFGYFAITNNPRSGREQPPLILHGTVENGRSRRPIR